MHFLVQTDKVENYPLCKGLDWAKTNPVMWSGTVNAFDVDCRYCKNKLKRQGKTVTP
jgi:hypothetical protein